MKGQTKILIMDVDGTLTDGKVYIGNAGELMKSFDIKDGYAIANILPSVGITPVIITGRKSEIVAIRCKELGIKEVYQGCLNKGEKILEIAFRLGFSPNDKNIIPNFAYIGDDKADLPGIELCELTGCPSDAVEEIKGKVDYICKKKGGHGAVREFIEWIIDNRINK